MKKISAILFGFFLVMQLFHTVKVKGQKYCTPSFTGCSTGDSIYFFQFGNYTRKSGCSGGYDTTQVKNSVLTVYRGKTYNLRIITNKATSLGAWIDYNRNGSYEDTAEMVAGDFNNTYDSINTSVTIPINVTPQVTRMRIMSESGGAGTLDYNKDCNSYSNGGEAEDYKITIAAYTNDIGILAINTPQALACPSSSEKVQVILTNYGTSSQTNIPFVLKYGSTSYSSTYKRTLAATKSDTFTVGFFNASTAANYSFTVYANLSSDGDRSNDTISTTVYISQPSAPTTSSFTHCGPASGMYLSAKATTSGANNYWFKNATTDTIFARADSIKIPYLASGTVTYFAESRLPNTNSLTKGNYNSARANYGNFFDVFTKQTIVADSFDVNSGASGVTDDITVYYRLGTYFGAERNSADWISLGKVTVNGKGSTNPTRLPLPKSVTLQVGNTYGFYIVPTSYQLYYDITGATGAYKSNNEISIRAGASTATAFAAGGTAVSPNRDWQGTIYYHYASCSSPRKSASITINQSPSGASFFKASLFQGQFNTGDISDPDNVCLGDTNTYQVTSPKGLSNSDFGTKWTISNLTFTTAAGTKIADTIVKIPTISKNGTFAFFPKKYADSIFVLKFKMKIIGSVCDSQIVRYIHVRAKPTAAFSYTNACLGSAISFKDSSFILNGSKVSKWNWDFGDATTSTSASPAHPYTKAGSYKVVLTASTAEGCASIISKTVTEYPVPKARWGAKSVCMGVAMNFLDSSTIPSGSIGSWKWNFGDGSVASTKQNPSYTFKKSGPYTVKLVVTSLSGCKDSFSSKIRIIAAPVSSFTPHIACTGATTYITDNSIDSSNTSTFTWNFGDGSAVSHANPSSHIYFKNGTYSLFQKVVTKSGCADSTSQLYTPYAKPTAALFVTNGCTGRAVTMADSSHAGKNAIYTWTYGDGGSDPTSTAFNTHTYSKAGKYKLNLLLANGNGCTDTQSRFVTIIDYAVPAFTATSVCQGKATIFTNATTGTGPLTYAWNFGDNTTISKISNPTHTYAKAGSYDVKLAAINPYGCVDSLKKTITVNPAPVIAPWIRKQDRYTVTFVPQDSSIGAFTWYFGTNTNDSSSKKQPVFNYPVGDAKYQVKLVVKNSKGCVSTRTDSIYTGKFNGIDLATNTFSGVEVYPNPFEESTTINYKLEIASKVTISVYDIQGKQVALLKDGKYPAGKYTDAFDARKYSVAKGVYFLKVVVNDKYFNTRIVNLK